MNRIQIFGISLLLITGCQLTAPTMPTLEIHDPFQFVPPTPKDFGGIPTPSPTLSTPTPSLEEPTIPDAPPEEKEFTFSFEPDAIVPKSEDEQAELLAKNQWDKNLARISMFDTGRILTANATSQEVRLRQQQIARLNDPRSASLQNRNFEEVDGSTSEWRWMHRGVETLYSIPPEHRASPKLFLKEKYKDNKILQANAAILWGRDGNPDAGRLLIQLVQSEATHIKIRCAAAEVLGRMPSITADDLLPLLDNVKDREVTQLNRQTGEMERRHQHGITEIWEELLIAIAEKINPWEHECFLEPFYATLADIRIANAKIWRRQSLQKRPDGTLPDKFLDIARRERNSTARVEIIRTLSAWNVPDLYRLLENDLRHPIAEVRNAAMVALADVRNQEVVPFIKDQLRDTLPANRAAAVSALRKIGEFDEVFKLVDDPAAPVRVEVAYAFAERCTPQTAKFAKNYMSDRFRDVQLATLEAVGGWSLEESGTLLLMGANSIHANVRRRAVEILAQKGIAYAGFDPDDRPENQTVQYQELVHAYREMVGVDPKLDFDVGNRSTAASASSAPSAIRQVSATVPDDRALAEVRRCLDDWSDQNQRQQIQRRLTIHGSRLMPMIDHIMTAEKRNIPESLDRVFAEVDPMFKEIEKLRSDDITAKRSAARELARSGDVNTPSKLATKRMMDIIARERDAAVLDALVSALQNADSELVGQLASPLLQSESVAVRRVASELLTQFGTSKDVAALQELLRDSNEMVVRGALQGIDSLWDANADNSSVLATMKMMLLQGSPALQVDVAATLHRLGQQEGTEALRRLAASSDHRVKVYVAQTVSELEDQVFVPILLRFLDDGNGTVRSEALKGLPKLTGQNIGRSGVSRVSDVAPTQQQIDLWKAWGRDRR